METLSIKTKDGKNDLCEALTKGGYQCSRTHVRHFSVPRKGSIKLCTQHFNLEKKKKKTNKAYTVLAVIGDPEPWTLLRVGVNPRQDNGSGALQKLRILLKKGPTKNRPLNGFIYIYYLDRDRQLQCFDYWKIGMTSREDYAERVGEWKSKHAKNADLVHKRTYPVCHPEFVERVLQLYFHYCRMERYQRKTKNGTDVMHSVRYKNKTVVIDGQQKNEDEKLVAKNKHTEWFNEEMDTIHVVLRAIISTVRVWKQRYKNAHFIR